MTERSAPNLPRPRLSALLRRGWGLGLLLFTLGGVLGWWVGGWVACARTTASCEVRWESVTALGTWVGGMGAIAAVLIGAQALRNDQAARDEVLRDRHAEVERAEAEAWKMARAVLVVVSPGGRFGNGRLGWVSVHIENRNPASDVHAVRATIDHPALKWHTYSAQIIAATGRLHGGKGSGEWADTTRDLDLIADSRAVKDLCQEIRQATTVEFHVADRDWVWRGGDLQLQPVSDGF